MTEERELTKEESIDNVNFLRAVIKMSSALSNLDSMVYDEKYVKFGFKTKATEWATAFQGTTSNIMPALVEEDEKMVLNIYNSFDDLDMGIEVKKDKKRELIVFYSKLKSSLEDLAKIVSPTVQSVVISHFSNELISQAETQYGQLLSDESVEDYIVRYNSFGKEIMYSKNELAGVDRESA